MEAAAGSDSPPETQTQETSMSPPVPPIQAISAAEDDPTTEGLPSPAKASTRVKRTLAKIRYQYELNIEPPEQDAVVQRDIMKYIGDNLKMEYKFNDTAFFVFSPMIVTSNDNEGNSPPPREENPFSFSVEGIKTSENWDSGKYQTNMTIQLKKRRPAAVEVVQDQPEQDQPNHDEGMVRGPYNFVNFIGNHIFQLIAFGVMALAILVGFAMAWILHN